MKIECYISHGCGSEKELGENLDRALSAEKNQAEVIIHRISDEKSILLQLRERWPVVHQIGISHQKPVTQSVK